MQARETQPTSAAHDSLSTAGRRSTRPPLQGVHLLAEWYGCPRTETLRKAERLKATCTQLAREAGFEVLSAHFHQLDPHGAMGVLLMHDAHLAIHTWPETGFVTCDVYACHRTSETCARSEAVVAKLRECLRPVWVNAAEVNRGVQDPEYA